MTGAGLDAVKRVPFGDIAAEWGYVRDPAAPARASPVLRAPGLPKPVTTRRGNGHWVYFSTLDPDDNGTAVDFMLRRGLSLSDIRARHQSPDAALRDFRGVWNGATPDPAPEWLAGRGVRRETLDACRPLVRRDGGGRVLFTHRDRNRALTGSGTGPPDGPAPSPMSGPSSSPRWRRGRGPSGGDPARSAPAPAARHAGETPATRRPGLERHRPRRHEGLTPRTSGMEPEGRAPPTRSRKVPNADGPRPECCPKARRTAEIPPF